MIYLCNEDICITKERQRKKIFIQTHPTVRSEPLISRTIPDWANLVDLSLSATENPRAPS